MEQLHPFLLAVDVGTSSLKAVLYHRSGKCIAAASCRYTYSTPYAGWAETEVNDWWQALVGALKELESQKHDLAKVEAVALTGQMHTFVLLDEKGEVIKPTILWLDRRAAAETAELQRQFDLPPYQLNSTYSLPKLLWLKRNQPDTIEQTRHILWAKDYLRYLLTGEMMTDLTEAGGAALLDWDNLRWAEDRMRWCGIDAHILPPLCKATDDAGRLLPRIASGLGLNPNARVFVGAGDVLALITGAPPQYGQVTCSLGTSSMIFAPVAQEWNRQDVQNRIYVYPLLPYRLLGGVSSTSGASLQWAWQALYEGSCSYDEAVRRALDIAPGSNDTVFLPFLTGERSPYWNDSLRGAFYGITLAHNRSHLLRAVMEGVAYSLRYLLGIFDELGVPISTVALAGGGTLTPGWAQMIADICKLPVAIYTGQETVTHGLFAYACQILHESDSFEQALLKVFKQPRLIQPDEQHHEVYDRLYKRYSLLADFSHQVLSC